MMNNFLAILDINSSILLFSDFISRFFFSNKIVFFHIDLSLPLFFFLFFLIAYHRPVTIFFVVDLL